MEVENQMESTRMVEANTEGIERKNILVRHTAKGPIATLFLKE